MQKKRIFYVYELWNPITNLPFYIGKGQGRRPYHHEEFVMKNNKINGNRHKYYTIRKILNLGFKVIVKTVFTTFNEDDAFKKEIELINKYGRKCKGTGTLTNIADGGKGSTGQDHKGIKNPMFNKRHSKRARKLISVHRTSGIQNGTIKPYRHSKEWRQHLKDNNPSSIKVDDQLIIKLSTLGSSVREISDITGITHKIIRNRLRKNNLSFNSKVRNRLIDLDVDTIYKLKKNGHSTNELSLMYNVSTSVINKRIRKYAKEKNLL